MIISGSAIAKDIYVKVAKTVALMPQTPVMVALTCAPNFETKSYLELKKRKAAEVGITLKVVELPENATTQDAIECIKIILDEASGVVVQLPFPPHIDRESLLQAIPPGKDPDGFSYIVNETACVPPVAGAIAEIAKQYSIDFVGKQVVVLGEGRLVGAPAALYLKRAGAKVTVVTKDTVDPVPIIKTADVLVSGIGVPHFVTADMVKDGVLIFDAGTSEDGGVMVGDVHPKVAEKAALFTPVPGGIGPITVAILLRNLVDLVR